MALIRKVKVWNNGSFLYQEDFNGQTITIPPKNFVVMDDPDASQFLGVFTGLRRDGHGKDITLKPLSKEYFRADEEIKADSFYACMSCKEQFKTEEDLKSHSKQHEAQLLKDNPTKKKFF